MKRLVLILTLIMIVSVLDIKVFALNESKTIKMSVSYDHSTAVDHIIYNAIKSLGYDVVIDVLGMESGYHLARSGENDGLCGETAGLEDTQLLRVGETVGTVEYYAYSMMTESMADIESWEQLKGLVVGIKYQKMYVENKLDEHGIQYVQATDEDSLLSLLLNGDIDVIVVENYESSINTRLNGAKVVGKIDSQPLYPYLNAKHSALLPLLEKSISEMKSSGIYDKLLNYEPIEQATQKSILIVTSYYADMEWEKKVLDGINTVLNNDSNVSAYTVSLNSNRTANIQDAYKPVSRAIRGNFKDKNPDLIIAVDDAAIKYVSTYGNTMFKGSKIVFCGANGSTDGIISANGSSAWGLGELIPAEQTVSQILKLYPKTQKIFVINDYTETGQLWTKEIKSQLQQFYSNVHIEYSSDITFANLLVFLQNIPSNTVILSGHYFVDAKGENYSQSDVQKAFKAATTVPIFGMLDTSIGYGQVGGRYVQARKQGEEAAKIALILLEGGALTTTIPVSDENNKWIFDYNALVHFGIKTSELPADSEIINRPASFYNADSSEFKTMLIIMIVGLLIICILIGFVVFSRRQNTKLKQTQKSLFTAEQLLDKDAELKKVKERLEKTLDSAPLIYALIADGEIIHTNNYLNANIMLKDNTMIIEEHEVDSTAYLYEHYAKYNSTENLIARLNMKNGEKHRFQLNLAEVEKDSKKAIVVWGVDIEDSERQKDYLTRTKHDLEKMLDTVPVPISIMHLDGDKLLYGNKSFLSWFGIRKDEIAGGVFISKTYPKNQPGGEDSKALIKEKLAVVTKTSEPQVWEWLYILPEGRELYASISCATIVYDEKLCIVMAIQDTGMERRRVQLLIEAAETEREANQVKGRFLMNMSHEMRTPMNAIIGLSQLALRKQQNDANKDAFRKINLSAKNLLSVINEILDFSKMEAEKMALIEEEFELEDVVSGACVVAVERIEDKNIEMNIEIDPAAPLYLIGDKTRIWQILKNLLDNAAKYTDVGKVTIYVSLLEDQQDIALLNFTVEDTGLGMTEAQLTKLFTPFEQFHKNAKNISTGTGLGMSITKQLVEIMGGTIEVVSQINTGTRASVTIPFKKADNHKNMAQLLRERKLDFSRILIVEDSLTARDIMKNILGIFSSLSVETAETCSEALKLVSEYNAKGQPFEVVIIDDWLGEVNGINVANELSAVLGDDCKKLITTAYAKRISTRMFETAGIVGVIEKPFLPSAFLDKLSTSSNEDDLKTAVEYNTFPEAQILLCEDNALNQQVATGMLDVFGIVPTIANDGREALDFLSIQKFDLVFMDILMPNMDGHEATLEIRYSGKPYSDIPIIAMTANVTQDEIMKCLTEGMNGHISKPLDIDDVYANLLKFLPKEKTSGATSVLEEQGKFAVSGVNTKEGIARFGGKADKYLKTLTSFAKNITDGLLPFEAMFSKENMDEAFKFIHTLKGVSGNLGVTEIYKAAQAFEKTLHENNHTNEFYNRLVELCSGYKQQILNAISPQTEQISRTKGEKDELLEIVTKLKAALTSYEPSECERYINLMREKYWDNIDDSVIQQIYEQIIEYNYDDAQTLLLNNFTEGENNE